MASATSREMKYAAPGEKYPGKTLSTMGVIFVFLVSPVGIVLCIIALVKSREAGYKNSRALSGLILGSLLFLLGVALAFASVAGYGSA
ncbi:hypothetical protein N1031_02900 [Herbiconiux moechotypicola]|uniref:DUF4190 domain-containing protein n=1 Tax=Herbiconiux moechotypicola TaxID=637393 RepID=A0ABN3DD47_9MICO|nr:hypothetical protein [Herbiconiux moechotypicola]MCS5728695.1 hypothetical protein [Herbiconiux moechotypicola]